MNFDNAFTMRETHTGALPRAMPLARLEEANIHFKDW